MLVVVFFDRCIFMMSLSFSLVLRIFELLEKVVDETPFEVVEREVLLEALEHLRSAIDARDNERAPRVDFHPEYGCAVVVCRGEFSAGQLTVNLVALDQWKFVVHARRQTAVCVDCTTMHCGELEDTPEAFAKFRTEVKRPLELAQNRSAGRSAMHGEKAGHQRTPAFIRVVVKVCECKNQR